MTDHFDPFGGEGRGPFQDRTKAMGLLPRKLSTRVPSIMCYFGGGSWVTVADETGGFGICKGNRNSTV